MQHVDRRLKKGRCMCVLEVFRQRKSYMKFFFLLKNKEEEITLWVQNGTFPATDL
jgi:hypothetical protein